jgi:hypothetical protein
MAGLDPAIHVFFSFRPKNVDARDTWCEDALRADAPGMTDAIELANTNNKGRKHSHGV